MAERIGVAQLSSRCLGLPTRLFGRAILRIDQRLPLLDHVLRAVVLVAAEGLWLEAFVALICGYWRVFGQSTQRRVVSLAHRKAFSAHKGTGPGGEDEYLPIGSMGVRRRGGAAREPHAASSSGTWELEDSFQLVTLSGNCFYGHQVGLDVSSMIFCPLRVNPSSQSDVTFYLEHFSMVPARPALRAGRGRFLTGRSKLRNRQRQLSLADRRVHLNRASAALGQARPDPGPSGARQCAGEARAADTVCRERHLAGRRRDGRHEQ